MFESIAALIDKSQPLIETYYGPGKLSTMVKQLQKECDKQAINVLQAFDMDRSFTQQGTVVIQYNLYCIETILDNSLYNCVVR